MMMTTNDHAWLWWWKGWRGLWPSIILFPLISRAGLFGALSGISPTITIRRFHHDHHIHHIHHRHLPNNYFRVSVLTTPIISEALEVEAFSYYHSTLLNILLMPKVSTWKPNSNLCCSSSGMCQTAIKLSHKLSKSVALSSSSSSSSLSLWWWISRSSSSSSSSPAPTLDNHHDYHYDENHCNMVVIWFSWWS